MILFIEKTWNYQLWATSKLFSAISRKLIEKPLIFVSQRIPFMRENWEKGKKGFRADVDNPPDGVNVAGAARLMYWYIFALYIFVVIGLGKLLGYEEVEAFTWLGIPVVLLAYATNNYLLWGNDKYKRYFKEFKGIANMNVVYIHAILFHVAMFAVVATLANIAMNFNL